MPESLSQEAERAHAAHERALAAAEAPLAGMSNDVLRAVALIDGGAALATLALLAASLRDNPAMSRALVWPLAVFGFGVTVAAFATGWSYLGQADHARALAARERSGTEPFLRDTPVSLAAASASERHRRLAMMAVFVAMASAVVGFALSGAILLWMLR